MGQNGSKSPREMTRDELIVYALGLEDELAKARAQRHQMQTRLSVLRVETAQVAREIEDLRARLDTCGGDQCAS